jgi:hypothetical protein
MVGESYFSDYEWAFESAEEAIQMCQVYQQQGGWPDESAEMGLSAIRLFIKDRGIPYASSEHCQGICVVKERTSTVGWCSFVETILGCVSRGSDSHLL